MDMHTNVKINGYVDATIDNSYALIRVTYRVKRGRKDYKIWLLPRDFRGTGIFPVCVSDKPNSQGLYNVLDMQNKVMFTQTKDVCIRFVKLANKDYYEAQG
jgi:hypothetical protein